MKSLLIPVFLSISFVQVANGRDPLVHVSLAKDNRIITYQLDDRDGTLNEVDSVMVDGGPGALAAHPTKPVIYASIRQVGHLASFSVDERTGTLTKINEVTAGADPAYLAIDGSGKYLMSAYYKAGKILVHAITENGAIGEELQSIATDERAHAIVPDRTSRFWFVPHTRPNAIFQFRFDADKQRLTANEPAKLTRRQQTGPRHLWFHPSLNTAYTSDEQGRSVSAYRFDPAQGTLELTQTLSTLPEDYDHNVGGSTSDIEVHPSGKYVYVANRGHDSIARFGVDMDLGTLVHLGNTESETTTRSFNIDPSGQLLIAAGQNSGKLAVFRIDPTDGDLTRINTFPTGNSPWWVLIR